MKQRVFLKSTLRQPVRTIFLLLLIGVISFAFATRAGEYLLIRQEVAEAGSYYRSIGTLEALRENVDYYAVTEYLEENERVGVVNRVRRTSGLLPEGVYNADVNGYNYPFYIDTAGIPDYREGDYSTPETAGDIPFFCPYDVLFYGTCTNLIRIESGAGAYNYCRFVVDEVLAGHPEHVSQGKEITVFLSDSGDQMPQPDGRYLIRATYNGVDERTADAHSSSYRYFIQNPLWRDGPMFLEAPSDLDLEQPQYERMQEELQMVRDNQRAIQVISMEDISAYPEVQTKDIYLTAGRWFTAEDNASGQPMCVLHQVLAQSLDLEVGDTLMLELRNIGSYNGYAGDEDWSTEIDDYLNPATETVEYEIVGLYDILYSGGYDLYQSDHTLWNYFTLNGIPDNFAYTYANEDTISGSSLVLTSPEEEDDFLTETEEDLRALGVRAVFYETGWDNFKTSAEAMTGAALGNVLIFGCVLLACLLLAAFLYFRFRRRDVAISRALGVPAGKCVGSAALPLVLVGGIGTVAGCALAWAYVDANAASLLSALAELSGGESGEAAAEAAALPIPWLVLLMVGLVVLLAVLALIFSAATARKSPLALLQGGSNRKK